MNYTDTELEREQWKPIFGYDGMYEVSNLGRVRSLKYGKTRVLKSEKNWSGYLRVRLSKDSKVNNYSVHRLVAQAFVHNDNVFNNEVNHIDEDKTNNRATNLEWCDRQYNNTYNGLRYRRPKPVQDKIRSLYDPELSIKHNLKLFKANDIECSRDTLWRLRKDLGLIKTSV